jgi:hypothetical protein
MPFNTVLSSLPLLLLGFSGSTTLSEPSLSKRVESSVEQALAVVTDRLENSAQCRSLFEPFDADGSEFLGDTYYQPAPLLQERRVCRNASAFTVVRHSVTYLCRSFARLPTARAAAILIHEALHFAGLRESPTHLGAPASGEINHRVAQSCNL